MTGSARARPERDPATDLARNYRVAFLRYLPGRDEGALAAAYDLGRHAMTDGVGMLPLVRIHHEVLRAIVAESAPSDVDAVLAAGADFLMEALGAPEMVQRRLRDLENGA